MDDAANRRNGKKRKRNVEQCLSGDTTDIFYQATCTKTRIPVKFDYESYSYKWRDCYVSTGSYFENAKDSSRISGSPTLSEMMKSLSALLDSSAVLQSSTVLECNSAINESVCDDCHSEDSRKCRVSSSFPLSTAAGAGFKPLQRIEKFKSNKWMYEEDLTIDMYGFDEEYKLPTALVVDLKRLKSINNSCVRRVLRCTSGYGTIRESALNNRTARFLLLHNPPDIESYKIDEELKKLTELAITINDSKMSTSLTSKLSSVKTEPSARFYQFEISEFVFGLIKSVDPKNDEWFSE